VSSNIEFLFIYVSGLPNDLGVFWQQYPWVLGEELCKFRALVSEMTNYTSVLTIVAFSMERYLAICHPLLSYAMSGLRRAIRIIAVLWLFGFLCATPFAVYTTINYVDFPPAAVVTTFFLCWAPFHAQRLIYLYARDSQYFASLNEWLFMIAGGFYYVSSTVNPILYNVMSVKYRQAFKQTLCCRGGSHGSFARDQSSFRETMVDVASPQWSRAMTWKRQPSRRPNNVSASA
ncbi:neuropeptides capa receptor-like, partial [Diaphorina citri]|uniref:Neuropeptides capa receptor-like n=1 Tax=Diaphorina citri TaxID=121845 RepID=A0A1S3DI11_DIACI